MHLDIVFKGSTSITVREIILLAISSYYWISKIWEVWKPTLVRFWGNRHFHTLLVETENGTTTMAGT